LQKDFKRRPSTATDFLIAGHEQASQK